MKQLLWKGSQPVIRLAPILKWAGGKRWSFEKNAAVFPANIGRFIEPFAGGAAAFFRLAPNKAWLNDLNVDLVETYKAIAVDWIAVENRLRVFQKYHSNDFYYQMRASRPRSMAGRAARFIYLNRTCFNGLYRVNLKGEFNVPVGTKTAVLLPDDNFALASERLRKTKLTSWDFEKVIDQTKSTDFVFADPPYTVRHNLNGFIKYNERLFSWADQVRLRDALYRARDRGVTVVMSNADHESIRDLYSESSMITSETRISRMAANIENRKTTTELLIRI
jgi:DNA adenine methylase